MAGLAVRSLWCDSGFLLPLYFSLAPCASTLLQLTRPTHHPQLCLAPFTPTLLLMTLHQPGVPRSAHSSYPHLSPKGQP